MVSYKPSLLCLCPGSTHSSLRMLSNGRPSCHFSLPFSKFCVTTPPSTGPSFRSHSHVTLSVRDSQAQYLTLFCLPPLLPFLVLSVPGHVHISRVVSLVGPTGQSSLLSQGVCFPHDAISTWPRVHLSLYPLPSPTDM